MTEASERAKRWQRETRVRAAAAALLAEILERQPWILGDNPVTSRPPAKSWNEDIVVDRVLVMRLYRAVEEARPGLVQRARETLRGAKGLWTKIEIE